MQLFGFEIFSKNILGGGGMFGLGDIGTRLTANG